MSLLPTLISIAITLGSLTAAPVITEFLASNDNTLLDEDGESSDWIEIHNPTTSPLDLVGWALTDDLTKPAKWIFPSTTLPPDGYLVVFASDKDRRDGSAELHTNFKLSAKGESLGLISPEGIIESSYQFPPQVPDYSYGLTPPGNTLVLIPETAPTRALVPDASDHLAFGEQWRSPSFDDSEWQSGQTGVGFEKSTGFENDIYLDLSTQAWGVNSTIYLRLPFSIPLQASSIESLTLRMKYDDGFSAFLNGVPVASDNAPTDLSWNSNATAGRPDSLAVEFQEFDLTSRIPELVSGDNLLAIHGLNQFSNSNDLLIRPQLIAEVNEATPSSPGYFSTPTPGARNSESNSPDPIGSPSGDVELSESSGVKTSPITVELLSKNPGEIRYTLDGSIPGPGSLIYSAPLTITNPTRLRARLYEPNRSAGPTTAGDYAFLEESVSEYLSAIPVLVMDNFGAGDYPNKGRSNDGRDVQQVPRQANVISIFEPTIDNLPFSQSPTLESRSGCRVRGSSSSQFPRKPLSLEFWKDDDSERKLSPFGMEKEADWVLNAPNPVYDRALIHNPVSFEFAKLMGAFAPDSRVIAVFQNTDGGKINLTDLAGIYIFSEKIERDRASVDFNKLDDSGTSGGWMINIDRMAAIPEDLPSNTIQPNFHAAGPNGILEIPDDQQNSGGSQSVDDISEFYHSYLNFHSPDGYEILNNQRSLIQSRIRAMDAAVWSPESSNPVTGYRAYLDADSWARAFAVHNFARNQDAHVLSTYLFQESPDSLIKMGAVWDFDRAYTWKGRARTTPLWASDRDWYAGLFADPDFRQLHQDLWQSARLESITNPALEELVDRASDGPNSGQVSASGLSYSSWQSRVSEMRRWVVDRANYLDEQYEPLPTVSPPLDEFSGSIAVMMQPSAGGTIYFTTDGSDPRASGGTPSGSASVYSDPLTINSRTRIIARTKNGSDWSGPVERNYYQSGNLPQLVVSEIHYHPLDPTPDEINLGFDEGKDFEFVELMNVGTSDLPLSSIALEGGINYRLPEITLLAGERIIVASHEAAFRARYGASPLLAGEFSGSLGNSGDQIIVRDVLIDRELLNFSYLDSSPWPTAADGEGYSLVLMNPSQSPDHGDPFNWRGSGLPGGNPGETDSRPPFDGIASEDRDSDGLEALMEHFLGTSDDVSFDGRNAYRLGFVGLPDGGYSPTFAVSYPIGSDDLAYQVQLSSDLKNWSDERSLLLNETHHGDGTITAEWGASFDDGSPLFFRLQVSQKLAD